MPVDEMAQALDEVLALMLRHVPLAQRPTLLLIMDMREAPFLPRGSEALLRGFTEKLFQGFRRRATLVSTPVGIMQAKRTTAEFSPSISTGVFYDEAEAYNYLLERS